jgi:hypothetical protein
MGCENLAKPNIAAAITIKLSKLTIRMATAT